VNFEANQIDAWERPKLERVGRLADIVQGGGGKLSLPTDDPGDAMKKPRGQENP